MVEVLYLGGEPRHLGCANYSNPLRECFQLADGLLDVGVIDLPVKISEEVNLMLVVLGFRGARIDPSQVNLVAGEYIQGLLKDTWLIGN